MAQIIIIDDAATVRLFYRQVLEGAGFVLDEAINGVEGLEKVLTQRPDMIFVDVNMPKMDGYAFLDALRRDPEAGGIPAVMISTEAQPRDAARAHAAGANFYLVKPPQPESLVRLAQLLVPGAVS